MEKQYQAFISYSQKDKRWAKKFHRHLEAYRVPDEIDVQGLDNKRKLGRIFRDEDELSSAPSLSQALTEALDSAENLIVLCSPNAAKSHWVNEEIKYFKSRKDRGKVFAIIVQGAPNSGNPETECFPPALRFKVDNQGEVTDIPDEPLAPDLNKDSFLKVKVRLIAGILNIKYDQLYNRELKIKRRRIINTALFSVMLTAIVLLMISSQYQRAEKFRQAELVSRSSSLVSQGERGLDAGANRFAEEKFSQALNLLDDETVKQRLLGAKNTGLHKNLTIPAANTQSVFFSRSGNLLFVVKKQELLVYQLDNPLTKTPLAIPISEGDLFTLDGAKDGLLSADKNGLLSRISFSFDEEPNYLIKSVGQFDDRECALVTAIQTGAKGGVLFVRGKTQDDFEQTCVFDIATHKKIKILTHVAPWSWTTKHYQLIEAAKGTVSIVEGTQVQGGMQSRVIKPKEMNLIGRWKESSGPLRAIFETNTQSQIFNNKRAQAVDVIVVSRDRFFCAGRLTTTLTDRLSNKSLSCGWERKRIEPDAPFVIDILHKGLIEKNRRGIFFLDTANNRYTKLRDLPLDTEKLHAFIAAPIRRVVIERTGQLELWSSASYAPTTHSFVELSGEKAVLNEDEIILRSISESRTHLSVVDLKNGQLRMNIMSGTSKNQSIIDWPIVGKENALDNQLKEIPSITLPCNILSSSTSLRNNHKQYALVNVENCDDDNTQSYLVTLDANNSLDGLALTVAEPRMVRDKNSKIEIQGLTDEGSMLLRLESDMKGWRIKQLLLLHNGWNGEGGITRLFGAPVNKSYIEYTQYYDRLGLKSQVSIHDGQGGQPFYDEQKEGYPDERLFVVATDAKESFAAIGDEKNLTIANLLQNTLSELKFEDNIESLKYCGQNLWLTSQSGKIFNISRDEQLSDRTLDFSLSPGSFIQAINCTTDGKYISFKWDDGSIALYSVERESPLFFIDFNTESSYLVFSPDNKKLILMDGGNRVRIWDIGQW